MVTVTFEGLYRVDIDVEANSQEEAYEKACEVLDDKLDEIGVVPIRDIEDFQPVGYYED